MISVKIDISLWSRRGRTWIAFLSMSKKDPSIIWSQIITPSFTIKKWHVRVTCSSHVTFIQHCTICDFVGETSAIPHRQNWNWSLFFIKNQLSSLLSLYGIRCNFFFFFCKFRVSTSSLSWEKNLKILSYFFCPPKSYY